MQASNCDRCYRRKSRCDKLQPCGSCQRASVSCSYTDKARQRRFTAEDLERVERRLRQAEARNRTLLDEVARLSRVNPNAQVASPSNTETSNAQDSQRRADAVTEVGYLSLNAAGERQPYLGSTSGVLFADLVRSSVDATVSRQPSPPSPEDGYVEQDFSHETVSNSGRRPEDLPTRALAGRLINAYFEHDAVAFPLLLPSELLETAERFYGDDDYYKTVATAYEVFVFNMVLAVATANVHKYDWQMLSSAESHHARAMRELNAVLARGGLQCLQAILLLCQYRQGSSVKDNSASMWHLVGIAARICLELGLHRESAYPLVQSQEHSEDHLRQFKRQEVSRRCFWSLMAMDRVTSNILGRPLAIRDEDVDTELPSESAADLLAYPLPSTSSGVSRNAVFNAIIQYRLLCGKVLITLHRRRGLGTSAAEALKSREDLAIDLEIWGSEVLRLKLPESAPSNERSCFFTAVWFRVLYANAKLMIWRPCPLLADLSHDHQSLQNIYDSSIQSIEAYATLHKSRKINYSWITLQSVFMAGLSFLYSVSRHLRDARKTGEGERCLLTHAPKAMNISQTSRACSNVMVAVAERWNALRHCHEVFDRLSDAVLADAIKLSTMPTGPSRALSTDATQHSVPMSDATATAANLPQPGYPPHSVPPTTSSSGWLAAQNTTALDFPPLAVDNEFLHCYDDLQSMYTNQTEDPVMHLSQDWLGYLGGLDGSMSSTAPVHSQYGMFPA